MARGKCRRRVAGAPVFKMFKPMGIPAADLDEIVLTVDELEAIRLADLEGFYQEDAATRMNVSRQTFGRIIESARHKTARVLVEGLALRIEGGEVEMLNSQPLSCDQQCQHVWNEPHGTGRAAACPACKRIDGPPLAGSDDAVKRKG
jgi:uncharacterized protein